MKKLLTIVFAATLFIACNNNGGIGMGGGWSKSEENEFMQSCTQGGQTKEICSCVLQKYEKKYPDHKEADAKGTAEDGRQWAMECMNGGGNGIGNDFNNNGKKDNNKDDDNYGNNDKGNNNQEAGWTNQQRQQYIQQCVGAATQQQGVTQEQANSYCECMTGKVEQKYSFRQANQLTAAEFQSEEWQNAAANCRAGY